jgi:hypothetical protein
MIQLIETRLIVLWIVAGMSNFWLTCWEPMQSCGVRLHQSSVSRARFVTTGAVDPKLCTYVPLESIHPIFLWLFGGD